MAGLIYDLLPGTPHPRADATISFPGVAEDVGLGNYWPGGSKRPAITALLTNTLDRQRARFCPLVLEIIRRAMLYSNGRAVTRELVTGLNALLTEVRFKIPELHDQEFLRRLPSSTESPVTAPTLTPDWKSALHGLVEGFKLISTGQPQKRGYDFEQFLNQLFAAFGLAPRGSFRLTGEQVDGSFLLDGATYLVEAKWLGAPIGAADLLVLDGKVSGKATWSRGLFVSVSGFTTEGVEAFARGKQTNIICMDGLDLHLLFENSLDLRDVLRNKARRAAETNQAFVSVRDLQP